MINFSVGPVQASDEVREIGSHQVPYFRTAEFSEVMLENEQLMKEFTNAPEASRVVFITGSGTASMEAAIMNTLSKDDRAIVVNGGSFGKRFEELLELHEIPHDTIRLDAGRALTPEILEAFDGKGYSAFVINMCETSTGVLYDMNMVGDFCRRNGLFLIVDAVSAFLAEKFDMKAIGADVMITGSQKALACPPGVSILVLAPAAIERIEKTKCFCMYLDLKSALKNGERGQTPFTPAVGTLLQINARLRQIKADGGADAETARIADLALYFREKIKELPFEIFSESCSNAVTSLRALSRGAYDIFLELKDNYEIWICPNGGELKDIVLRVGHLGFLHYEDYDKLVDALLDMMDKNAL